MTSPKTPSSETSPFARPIKRLVRLLAGRPDPQLPSEGEIPITETFELLAQERRQVILEKLATASTTPISTSSLAERVACTEYECDPDELEDDQRKRVYIAVTQSHLPTLQEADIVTHDTDAQLVDRGPKFDRLWRTYMAVLETLSG